MYILLLMLLEQKLQSKVIMHTVANSKTYNKFYWKFIKHTCQQYLQQQKVLKLQWLGHEICDYSERLFLTLGPISNFYVNDDMDFIMGENVNLPADSFSFIDPTRGKRVNSKPVARKDLLINFNNK